MALPLAAALPALSSLFGGGSQSTANNSFNQSTNFTPVISIGGSVGQDSNASGSAESRANPTFSQSATPNGLGLGGAFGSETFDPDAFSVASAAPPGSFITNPFVLGGIGLIGLAVFFSTGGKS